MARCTETDDWHADTFHGRRVTVEFETIRAVGIADRVAVWTGGFVRVPRRNALPRHQLYSRPPGGVDLVDIALASRRSGQHIVSASATTGQSGVSPVGIAQTELANGGNKLTAAVC
jgi:hypothetical protein